MEKIQVTRLSSKGQVVLPQGVRDRLHLEEGARFVVVAENDTIVLKRLELPSMSGAQALIYRSRAYARKARLSAKNLRASIQKARAK